MDPPFENMTPEGGDECSYDPGGSDGDEVKDSLVAMGTVMVVAASFISCFGLNLQKLSHNKNEARDPSERQPMYMSWVWVLGMACMVMGSVLDMVALPFVPLSRVSALGASGMVANILITPVFLGEKLTRHDIIGGTVTVLGTTIACIFGASSEPKVTSYCLLNNFTEKLYIIYAIILVLFLVFLYYHIVAFRRKQTAMVINGHIVEFLECVWAWQNKDALNDTPGDEKFRFTTKFGPQFYPVVHAVFAGTFGAQSVMFAKAVLIFFRNAVDGTEVGKSVAMLFVFLVPTVLCLWFQIGYLNMSMQIYRDALFILPVYQSMWISIGIISGLIFYQEYKAIDGYHVALFIVGVGIALLGLVILTKRSSATPEVQSPLSLQQQNKSAFEDTPSETTTVINKRGIAADLKNLSFNQVLAPGTLAESFSLLQDYRHHHGEFSTQLEGAPLVGKKAETYSGAVVHLD